VGPLDQDEEDLQKEIHKLRKQAKRKERQLGKAEEHRNLRLSTGKLTPPCSPLQSRSVNAQHQDDQGTREQIKTHANILSKEKNGVPRRAIETRPDVSLAPAPAAHHRTVQMKVLVVGDTKCGKTSIIQRYCYDKFEKDYTTTVGADFARKVIPWDENTTIRLQLWDIAGQDRFAELTRAYFRNAIGAVVVCDVTRPLTTDSVKAWKKVLDEKVFLPNGKNVPVVLIANKTDLLQGGTESFETGARIEKAFTENKFVDWYVASAKEDSNITEAVESLTAKILQNHREQVVALADKNPGGVVGTGTPGTATKINLHEDEGACRVGPRGKCCG